MITQDADFTAALQHAIDTKTKPVGSLGRMEALAARIARIQGTLKPSAETCLLTIFAADHGMAASLCGQADLMGPGLGEARCIDADRLSEFAENEIAGGGRAHRQVCACAASIDIGAYDTYPHGCVYCYAVRSRDKAKPALAGHDAKADMLG